MKRLQIMIDEDLDTDLERMAARERTSKAALIRRFVRERIGEREEENDSIWEMVGAADFEPGNIDEVVYR